MTTNEAEALLPFGSEERVHAGTGGRYGLLETLKSGDVALFAF